MNVLSFQRIAVVEEAMVVNEKHVGSSCHRVLVTKERAHEISIRLEQRAHGNKFENSILNYRRDRNEKPATTVAIIARH